MTRWYLTIGRRLGREELWCGNGGFREGGPLLAQRKCNNRKKGALPAWLEGGNRRAGVCGAGWLRHRAMGVRGLCLASPYVVGARVASLLRFRLWIPVLAPRPGPAASVLPIVRLRALAGEMGAWSLLLGLRGRYAARPSLPLVGEMGLSAAPCERGRSVCVGRGEGVSPRGKGERGKWSKSHSLHGRTYGLRRPGQDLVVGCGRLYGVALEWLHGVLPGCRLLPLSAAAISPCLRLRPPDGPWS